MLWILNVHFAWVCRHVGEGAGNDRCSQLWEGRRESRRAGESGIYRVTKRAAETCSVWSSGAYLRYTIHSDVSLPSAAVMWDPHSWLPQPVDDRKSPIIRMSKISILVLLSILTTFTLDKSFVSGDPILLALKSWEADPGPPCSPSSINLCALQSKKQESLTQCCCLEEAWSSEILLKAILLGFVPLANVFSLHRMKDTWLWEGEWFCHAKVIIKPGMMSSGWPLQGQ